MVGVVGQRRAEDVGHRLVVARERRLDGSAAWTATTVGLGSFSPVLVEVHEVGIHKRGRVPQRRHRPGRYRGSRRLSSGNAMSRSDFSGARTRNRSVWPSGLRKARTVTSLGTSWADGPDLQAERKDDQDQGDSRTHRQTPQLTTAVSSVLRAVQAYDAPVR